VNQALSGTNEPLRRLKAPARSQGLGQQPLGKTFGGRISRGLIPWTTQFPPAGLEVAPQAVESCVERVSRLYERGVDLSHIGAYVRRWQRWASSGLRDTGE